MRLSRFTVWLSSSRLVRLAGTAGFVALLSGFTMVARQAGPVFDEDVSVRSFAELTYPTVQRAAKIQGAVVVEVALDGDGNVTSARALSGPRSLIEVAVANATKWTFKPNDVNRAILIYNFRIQGVCNQSSTVFSVERNAATVTTCQMPGSIG